MNIEPSLYNNQNQLQTRDARVLIDRAKHDYINK